MMNFRRPFEPGEIVVPKLSTKYHADRCKFDEYVVLADDGGGRIQALNRFGKVLDFPAVALRRTRFGSLVHGLRSIVWPRDAIATAKRGAFEIALPVAALVVMVAMVALPFYALGEFAEQIGADTEAGVWDVKKPDPDTYTNDAASAITFDGGSQDAGVRYLIATPAPEAGR